MTDNPRLIEHAFPLKQASLDSVHEKNVRHGHISTLHIWPARRPLAACRAALIATLLPDPSATEARRHERRMAKEIAAGARNSARRSAARWSRRSRRRRCPTARSSSARRRIPRAASCTGGGRRKTRKPGVVPAGNPQGLRRARAEGARPVRGRRGDPAGGHAPGLRGDRRGHQPGRLVHPQMHAGIPAEAGREDAAPAGFHPRERGVHGGLLQGASAPGRPDQDGRRSRKRNSQATCS